MEVIKYKSWSWLEAKLKTFHFSYFEWYSNPLSSIQYLLWMKIILVGEENEIRWLKSGLNWCWMNINM